MRRRHRKVRFLRSTLTSIAHPLPCSAEQYHNLYCRAFARLEDISRQAEQAVQELEELPLSMGDRPE